PSQRTGVKRGRKGLIPLMAVRAQSLAVMFGLAAFAGALTAGIAGAGQAPDNGAGEFPVASEGRLAGDEMLTRMVVDLNQKIEIRPFTLANPYRIVVDMPQVAFQFPAKTGESGRGLIKAFRFGLVIQGGSRMVIDLTRPARVEKAFVIDAA